MTLSSSNQVEIEYYVLTPSMLGQFVRNKRWGIEAYYRKLYGIEKPKTKQMDEGEKLHEKYGFTNEKKFVKKFQIMPNVYVELRGIPDKIDENGRPWEAKTTDGTFVPESKIEGAKTQLLCYLFLMDKDYGFLEFISRTTGKPLEAMRTVVFRDDKKLFSIIKNFIYELRKQKQLI